MAPAASEGVQVGMRMRPMVGHEAGQLPCLQIAGNEISLLHENLSQEDQEQYHDQTAPFCFDVVMDSSDKESAAFCSNDKCYDLMGKPLVENVLKGFNACLFCYGQTGTGKTATIMGYPELGEGLLPRMLGDMVKEADKMRENGSKVSLKASMLEVYNEGLNDLLVDRDLWGETKIRTAVMPQGVIIKGASQRDVLTKEDAIQILDEGTERKTVAATKMNPVSSRGHTVFRLVLEKSGGADATKLHCEILFADLAGHENIKTTAVTGDRLTELKFINSSLMYLQRALENMARNPPKAGKKPNLSPFRNSELTLLMANGLVGNSKATVIVTLSPAAQHFDTSFSSIEFALQVKGIKVEVSTNVSADPQEQIRQLKAEVAELKQKLADEQGPAPSVDGGVAGSEDLKKQVATLQKRLDEATAQLAEARAALKKAEEQFAVGDLAARPVDSPAGAQPAADSAAVSAAPASAATATVADAGRVASAAGEAQLAQLHTQVAELKRKLAETQAQLAKSEADGKQAPSNELFTVKLKEMLVQLRGVAGELANLEA